ncbi:DUF7033 domain-containing protein [Enterovibrio norvegicus]|uniref:DUF7033 domain-containing protein n=1 Tax=Enterovibrio norvegicus DSM 15893 TaxID=1121869 RepID=A0A1I5N9C0_9GAMM|nr:hypothetical protein [Enterovibrio norvegicus]SFP18232.1 hypothetical protein SAMN03084138_01523 [Enterovibrio norvegicus DSM 15893]
MINIRSPLGIEVEVTYTLDFIFNTCLKIPYSVTSEDRDDFLITLPSGRTLSLSSAWWKHLSSGAPSEALLPTSIANVPLQGYPEKVAPVLFGIPEMNISNDRIDCQIDVLGTIFFTLSRVEEIIVKDRDSLGRFCSEHSAAYKFGYLERPIVDEYVFYLHYLLRELDSNLPDITVDSEIFVTCDVDYPFDISNNSWLSIFRCAAAKLLRARSITKSFSALSHGVLVKLGLSVDHYTNAVKSIIQDNDRVGNKVAFYFIPKVTSKFDPDIDFLSQKAKDVVKIVADSGHEVGVHLGFQTEADEKVTAESMSRYVQALRELGISTDHIGCRMHYLKWDAYNTPSNLEINGIAYDTTLAFADRSGFRCGTSKRFPLYDWKNRRKSNVIEVPLINMEVTVMSDSYEGVSTPNDLVLRMNKFKALTRKYGGTYTLLWHNNNLIEKQWREAYKELVQ